MKILTARYILPIASEPIIDGAVAIDGDKIAAVGASDQLINEFPAAPIEHLGEAAIVPGFINCHSHLELTALRGALDAVEHDFRAWLLKLNAMRASMTDDEIGISALAGAIEGQRAGVTCFGDIGRTGQAGLRALKATGLRGVIFQETDFSPDARTADEDLVKLREKFRDLCVNETDLVKAGLSPHSPYTVSRKLFDGIARFAADEKIKVSIHAAESAAEEELMRNGTGFFTSVYEKFSVEWESPRCSSIEFLAETGILETRPLLAHCVTVSEADIDLIASSGATIAHCPKSNAKFGHGAAPFEKFLSAGIGVGLGSDSVASNNMCDMLEEARSAAFFARNRPNRQRLLTARQVLETATIGGARALGLGDQIGSLETGKQADLAVVSLSDIAQQPVTDIHAALVFASTARDVRLTMVSGREVYRKGDNKHDEERIGARLDEIATKLGPIS